MPLAKVIQHLRDLIEILLIRFDLSLPFTRC